MILQPFSPFEPGAGVVGGDPTRVLIFSQDSPLVADGATSQNYTTFDWSLYKELEVEFFWNGPAPSATAETWFQNTAGTSAGINLLGTTTGTKLVQSVYGSGGGSLDLTTASLSPLFDLSTYKVEQKYNVDGQISTSVDGTEKGLLSTLFSTSTSAENWLEIGSTGPSGVGNFLQSGTISGLKIYARVTPDNLLCKQWYPLECDGTNYQAKYCPWSASAPVIRWSGVGTVEPSTPKVFWSARQTSIAAGVDMYFDAAGNVVVRNRASTIVLTCPVTPFLTGNLYNAQVDYVGGNLRLLINGTVLCESAATWKAPTHNKIGIGADLSGSFVLNDHDITSFEVE